MKLAVLVLHARNPAETRAFYEQLGARFVDERHGEGTPHVAATLDDGLVLEIYPGVAGPLRLELEVQHDVWARRGRGPHVDPDGRKVLLSARAAS